MSVAIDCRLMYYRKAGIVHYTRRLVQALASLDVSGFIPHILLDRRDTDIAWVPANVKITRTVTPAHHRYERVILPLELSRFTSEVSLLHSPDFITCAGRFKKVITIHDLYFMEHPEVMSADGVRYYGRVRRSAQQADRIIAVSRFTRDDVIRLMPEVARKVVVIHEAADKLRVENEELRIDDVLSQFFPRSRLAGGFAGSGIGTILNSQFLLFVGTLEPRKNLTTLLRALARLPDDVRLVVVGSEGWGDTEPGRLARDLRMSDRVTLAGRVSDAELDALYRRARLLVMPSLSEGFGLPVLEAMARGTPVVCSNSGSLPEIAEDAALLHDPLDDATLAQHIHALWLDNTLHAEYSRHGIARAAQFSWSRAAEETLAVYRAALQNRKPAI